MSEEMRISAVGIPWYRREDYPRILAVMADRHLLPASFHAWLQAAQQTVEKIKASGQVPVKAHVSPDEFVAWCRSRGLDINADARMEFAATVARAMYQDGHS